MERCPECGNKEFRAIQRRTYGVIVSIIPNVGPQWERDDEESPNPQKRGEPYGRFECTECTADFAFWQDIPDPPDPEGE